MRIKYFDARKEMVLEAPDGAKENVPFHGICHQITSDGSLFGGWGGTFKLRNINRYFEEAQVFQLDPFSEEWVRVIYPGSYYEDIQLERHPAG